ncbi:hypothetical protein DDW09_05080 [Sulfolobus sp. SCGC AB-777_L09]|jgi:hypothetical protein|uniref:hypothetical protein n=1 Tax=Saccharolobus islandicus TaxID=43080 RepID=UPI00064F2B7A|nr:hypothetical protein [Sulfolobus islandicus]PVU69115.1 hypothetical protein DDW09_05080 [Sulfolobus sp. SCGC AB-777_L09]
MHEELIEYYEALKLCEDCEEIITKLREHLALINKDSIVSKKVSIINNSNNVNVIRETLFQLIFYLYGK